VRRGGGAGAAGRCACEGAGTGVRRGYGSGSGSAVTPSTSSRTRVRSDWLSKGLATFPSARTARARASSKGSKVPVSSSTGTSESWGSDFRA
jgi:hypothetical protein